MSTDLSAFFRHGAANTNSLRDCLSWSMLLPTAERIHVRYGLPVVVVVGRSLSVQVLETVTGREIAFGEFSHGSVGWESLDVERFCVTADSMVQDAVKRALWFFAKGICDASWISPSRQRELRHVA